MLLFCTIFHSIAERSHSKYTDVLFLIVFIELFIMIAKHTRTEFEVFSIVSTGFSTLLLCFFPLAIRFLFYFVLFTSLFHLDLYRFLLLLWWFVLREKTDGLCTIHDIVQKHIRLLRVEKNKKWLNCLTSNRSGTSIFRRVPLEIVYYKHTHTHQCV